MNKKKAISLIIALTLLITPTTAQAAGAAGSSGDPLVSKSYVDSTFKDSVLKDPLELIKNAIAVLEYKLSQKLSGVTAQTVNSGGGISVTTGGNFTLLSGGAVVTSLTGTLIDISDGKTLAAGQALTVRHRYVAGPATVANISATAQSLITSTGSVSTQNSAMAFTDVATNAWFYESVRYAHSRGLINGKSTTSFAPDDNLKINEAIKLAACMHQLYNTGTVSLTNGTEKWYSTYLAYCVSNGIVTRTYADYDVWITRNEFVNIFYAALPVGQYTAKNSVADNSIPDVKLTDSYAAQIYSFYRAGILNGKDASGSFLPTQNILRSEVSAIVTRMFEKDHRVSITLP